MYHPLVQRIVIATVWSAIEKQDRIITRVIIATAAPKSISTGARTVNIQIPTTFSATRCGPTKQSFIIRNTND